MINYQEAFKKIDSTVNKDEVIEKTAQIIEKEAEGNYNIDVLRLIHGCIDITSLSAIDTEGSILKLVGSVNDLEGSQPGLPNVAAICTYPNFVETVKNNLTAKDVKIAAVTGGFPSSQTFEEVKIAETALAVMNGAEEIDTVLNLGYFLNDDFEALYSELQEIKDSARGMTFKVILETGALSTIDNIRKASIVSIYAGADFIKTSTGKEFPGATAEAVYTMCRVIKQVYEIEKIKIGIKVSGGIKKTEDAVKYYTIIKSVLGEEWLNKSLFRIGASSLIKDISSEINKY